MPSISATKKLIQRARAQNEAHLPTHTGLASLVVPDQYKFYYHPSPDVDKLFLLRDSGQADPNGMMIFGRVSHRNWVQDMDRVFIDGTLTSLLRCLARCLRFLPSMQNTCFP